MADKDYDSGEEEEQTIADDVVVTKYNMAAKVANGKFYRINGFFHFVVYLRKNFVLIKPYFLVYRVFKNTL